MFIILTIDVLWHCCAEILFEIYKGFSLPGASWRRVPCGASPI